MSDEHYARLANELRDHQNGGRRHECEAAADAIESLQSQLAAANERADAAVQALEDARVLLRKARADYQCYTHTAGMVDEIGAFLAGQAAPVPAQPAAPVPDAVMRALIEAAQMAVEMIETEKHERRHVRWALKDALLAAKPADTEGRKDD